MLLRPSVEANQNVEKNRCHCGAGQLQICSAPVSDPCVRKSWTKNPDRMDIITHTPEGEQVDAARRHAHLVV